MSVTEKTDVITKRDIAQFIKETAADDGEMTPYNRAAASTAWAIWDSIGKEDVDYDLSQEDADRILSQFPLKQDESLELEK